MKSIQNILTRLPLLAIVLFFACEQSGQITKPSDSTNAVTVNNHGELLSRGAVKAEISTSVPEGTVYQCSCGEWHNAQGGEKLYSQNRCDNLNGFTFSLQLKAKSAATLESASQVSLSQIQGTVVYVDGVGISHTVTSNQVVNAVKVITGNASSVWIGSSETIKISDDVDLGED